MAKSFHELERKMSAASRARSDAKAQALIEEMPLHASISKLERRADMYISTLRDFVRAMGGELEITARFPEGEVRIKQLDLEKTT